MEKKYIIELSKYRVEFLRKPGGIPPIDSKQIREWSKMLGLSKEDLEKLALYDDDRLRLFTRNSIPLPKKPPSSSVIRFAESLRPDLRKNIVFYFLDPSYWAQFTVSDRTTLENLEGSGGSYIQAGKEILAYIRLYRGASSARYWVETVKKDKFTYVAYMVHWYPRAGGGLEIDKLVYRMVEDTKESLAPLLVKYRLMRSL